MAADENSLTSEIWLVPETRRVLDSMADRFVAYDRHLNIVFVNRAVVEATALAYGDLVGRNQWDVNPETRGTVVEEYYARAFATGLAAHFQFQHPRSGAWMDVDAIPSGGFLHVYFRDITDRKRAEASLRESEAQYRQIAEGLPQLVWSAGPDGVRDYFNRRWLEFTGIGLEQEDNPWLRALHDEDRSRALAAWAQAVERGQTFQAEYRLRGREGRYRWFLGRATAIRNEEGEIVRWFGTCTDIHDQKAAQHVLEITNEFMIALAEDLDLERIVQSLTDASTSAIGAESGAFFYTAADDDGKALQRSALSGTARESLEKLGLVRATETFGSVLRGEGVVRSDDATKDPRFVKTDPRHGMASGHVPIVSYLAVPVVSRRGDVVGGLFFGHSQPGMFTDEHDRIVTSFAAQAAVAIDNARLYDQVRLAKEDLERQVQERTADLQLAVERLQGFTYHVSHDLRAPLRSIASTSRIIQEDYGTRIPPEVNTLLDRQVEAARKLAQLVDDLLQLSRISHQEMVRQPVDMTALAREAAAEAHSSHLNSTARVEVTEGLHAEGDPRLLRLALLNLIENAIKYSPAGGTVAVGQEGEHTFVVRDEGIGMESQYLHKIFEPFQRLHRDEEFGGTGIGLANVQQVIERHGGRVWVESQPGRGSTFYFTLCAEGPDVVDPQSTGD